MVVKIAIYVVKTQFSILLICTRLQVYLEHLISCLCLYLAAFPQIIKLPLLSIFVLRLSPFDEFFLVDFLIIMGEQSGSGMAGFLYKKQFEFICIFGLEFIHFRSTKLRCQKIKLLFLIQSILVTRKKNLGYRQDQ